MRCPNCDSEIVDDQAVFCPRCGGALGASEVEVTEKLEVPAAIAPPDDAGETDALERPSETSAPESSTTESQAETSATESPAPESPAPASPAPASPAPAAAVRELAETVRRSFVARWLDATAAACLAFLVLLCVGAVLLVAAKLQYPGFGAGANPIEVLTSVTILGLAVLRAPIHFGNLQVTTLPFGALAAAGAGIAWATRIATKDRPPADGMERVMAGVRLAVPFAVVCWLAALVFRFRGGDEVFAGAWGALFWGAIWGGVFGAVGTATSGRELLGRLRELTLIPGEGPARRGLSAGVVMLATAAGLAAAATLLGIIVALASGAPREGFGAGDAAAAIVYLIAFAPNVLVALTALGLGSVVDVGARVTVAGGRLGSVRELSLFSWGQDATPGVAYLLLLVPLLATVFGGYYARRRGSDSMTTVLGVATAVFALMLFAVVLLGDARLGGGLAGRGVAHVSVHAFRTLVLAAVWGAVGGFLGWKLAEFQKGAD